ncbi:CHAT domain-containing protein [Leptolyngbya sp. FACHB-711]|nr:CHAT domain-containing protein [Leptolyngbya sp. FACHB-711]
MKILLLAANPKDSRHLRLDEEIREIEDKLRKANYRDRFELISKQAVRVDDVRDELLHYAPQIVHFSGHGVGQPGLVLEDDRGNQALVDTEALARLFKSFSNTVECVLLNACYSEVQAAAIHRHIHYVIGMNQAIGDRAAIEFAKGFYATLGAGRSIRDAFEIGCASLDLKNIPESNKPQIKPEIEDENVSRKLILVPQPETQTQTEPIALLQSESQSAQPAPKKDSSPEKPESNRPSTINAQNSQGFINNASAPVTQHFGNQTTINTGGGDYAGRDLYKGDRSTRLDTVSLQTIADQLAQLAEQAENRGDDDLADDLRSIGSTLGAAMKAEQEGKQERRGAKLGEVRRSIEGLTKKYPELQDVMGMLQQM